MSITHLQVAATALVAVAGFVMVCGARAAVPATSPVVAASTTASDKLASAIAIVVQDQAALRASPRDSAAQQAVLWQGDALEIRGERMEFLQVYDHRRERAGFVRASQVRRVSLAETDAPEALAVMRFLRDQPGSEALGIAYAAAYLRAVPAAQMTAEPLDALGQMAERLARRASTRQAQGKAADLTLSAHLEVVAAYGVDITSFERNGRIQLCYDGDAFKRVLVMRSDNAERAHAALALTRHECIDPAMNPLDRQRVDEARAELLERIDLQGLPEMLKNRVKLRRAGVWAGIAFDRKRKGESSASTAAEHAMQALAGIDKTQLSDADEWTYAEAGVRVSASRWSAEPAPSSNAPVTRLSVATSPGQPGETCLSLVDAKHGPDKPLLKRCTYGTVWTASASTNANGTALALAVQPLATWRELWVFHRVNNAWVLDALPPSSAEPELGVVEFAGWVPGGTRMLVAREAKVDGRFKRSYEVLRMDTLTTENRADRPDALSTFHRWQDPRWKQVTLSLR